MREKKSEMMARYELAIYDLGCVNADLRQKNSNLNRDIVALMHKGQQERQHVAVANAERESAEKDRDYWKELAHQKLRATTT